LLLPGVYAVTAQVIACRGRLARWLEAPFLRTLGSFSYAYYLCHGLTLKVVLFSLHAFLPALGPSTIFFWSALPAVYAITLGTGWTWFRLVETPLASVRLSMPESTPARTYKLTA